MINPAIAPQLHLLLHLGCALIVGGIIGLERERQRHAAGLRTHILVSLGAALFVLIPIQAGLPLQDWGQLSRVIQGVITGVGFIGGGVILHQPRRADQHLVAQGVTTAASIWLAAAVGVAAGMGLWLLAIAGAGLGWVVLSQFKALERWIHR